MSPGNLRLNRTGCKPRVLNTRLYCLAIFLNLLNSPQPARISFQVTSCFRFFQRILRLYYVTNSCTISYYFETQYGAHVIFLSFIFCRETTQKYKFFFVCVFYRKKDCKSHKDRLEIIHPDRGGMLVITYMKPNTENAVHDF